jgi:hypothetical protein
MTPNSGTLAAGVDSEMLKLSLNRLAPTWPYLKALCGSSPGPCQGAGRLSLRAKKVKLLARCQRLSLV